MYSKSVCVLIFWLSPILHACWGNECDCWARDHGHVFGHNNEGKNTTVYVHGVFCLRSVTKYWHMHVFFADSSFQRKCFGCRLFLENYNIMHFQVCFHKVFFKNYFDPFAWSNGTFRSIWDVHHGVTHHQVCSAIGRFLVCCLKEQGTVWYMQITAYYI